MQVVLTMLGAILALAAVMIVTGWAFAVLVGIERLRSFRLEAVLANAFVGTGAWILLYSICSYLGLSAREACWPLAAGVGSLLVVAVVVKRPRIAVKNYMSAPVLAHGAAGLLAIWMVLQMVRVCHCAYPFDDTMTYISISKWLQDNGFGLQPIPPEPDRLVIDLVRIYQNGQLRMGSTFFLALLEAYSGFDAVLVYPVVMAWGMLLNLAGIALLMRWTLRQTRWVAAGAVLLAAAAFNPLHGSIMLGFQPQNFGTAYLSFAIAVLSRSTRATFWTRGNSILLAVAITSFIRVYSDLAPVLALVATGSVMLTALRAWRGEQLPRYLRFVAWTLLALLVLGNIEWIRAWHALRSQVGSAVGWVIPWTFWDYVTFALGARPIQQYPGLHTLHVALGVLAFLLLTIGLTRVLRDRRAALIGLALAIYAGMAICFSAVASNDLERTWPLFKICKWAFPLVLAVQFVGLALLAKRFTRRAAVLLLPGLMIYFAAINQQRPWTKQYQGVMLKYTQSADPVDIWNSMLAQLDTKGIERVVLLNVEHDRPTRIAPYVFDPRPTSLRPVDPQELGRHVAMILWGGEPLAIHGEHLPGGMILLDQSQPQLFDFERPATRSRSDQDESIRVGQEEAKCRLWSPRNGIVRWQATLASETAVQPWLLVHFFGPDGLVERTCEGDALDIVLEVPAGYSHISIRSLDGVSVRIDGSSIEFDDKKPTPSAVEPRLD